LSDGERVPGPALAIVELASIARGHRVADAMCKRAPVQLMRADAISPGKFVVLVEGDVAAVDESFRVGTDVAADRAVDKLFLPQPHAGLWPAIAGEANARGGVESLGIVETTTVAATVRAADAALKAARVSVTEMQLGRGIGGKAFFTVTGPLAEVEAAVDAAVGVIEAALVHTTEIIPAPHEDLVAKLR
jgi:microcompartment protein CcmL/EutN